MLPRHGLYPRGMILPTARKISTALAGHSQNAIRVSTPNFIARLGTRFFFKLRPTQTAGAPKARTTAKSSTGRKTRKPHEPATSPTARSNDAVPLEKLGGRTQSVKRKRRAKSTHHDLPSWLEHVKCEGIDISRGLHKGTNFEYSTQNGLQLYSFQLTRVGGRNDLGIDLIGTWTLPSAPYELKVLVQCKAYEASPAHVRELQSAFANSAIHGGSHSIALLVSSKPATKGVLNAVQQCPRPMAFVYMSSDGLLQQFVINDVGMQATLSGLSTRETLVPMAEGRIKKLVRGTRFKRAIALCWQGKKWPGQD